MAEPPFFAFLDRTLLAIEADVPQAYDALQRALARAPLRMTVDGHVRHLVFEQGRHRLAPAGAHVVELQTTRDAIVALVEARTPLLDSVVSDALLLRAAPEDLASFHDALTAFIQGAVRTSEAPAALAAYLGPPGDFGRNAPLQRVPVE